MKSNVPWTNLDTSELVKTIRYEHILGLTVPYSPPTVIPQNDIDWMSKLAMVKNPAFLENSVGSAKTKDTSNSIIACQRYDLGSLMKRLNSECIQAMGTDQNRNEENVPSLNIHDY